MYLILILLSLLGQTSNNWQDIGPSTAGSFYVGLIAETGELYSHAEYPGNDELFISTDGGNFWSRLIELDWGCYTTSEDNFGRLIITGNGYIGIYSNATWTTHPLPEGVLFKDLTINPVNPDHFIGVVEDSNCSIFQSFSGGTEWVELETAPPFPGYVVSFSPDNPDVIYFLSFTSSNKLLVYKSLDAGYSWNDVSPENVVTTAYQNIAIQVFNPNTIFVASHKDAYYSDNGGSAWSHTLDTEALVYDLHFSEESEILYLLSEESLYSSTDKGQTWTLDYTLPGTYPSAFSVTESDGYILIGTIDGLIGATNPSGPWTKTGMGIPGGDIYDLSCDPLSSSGYPLFTGEYFLDETPYSFSEMTSLPIYSTRAVDRSDTSSEILFAGGQGYG